MLCCKAWLLQVFLFRLFMHVGVNQYQVKIWYRCSPFPKMKILSEHFYVRHHEAKDCCSKKNWAETEWMNLLSLLCFCIFCLMPFYLPVKITLRAWKTYEEILQRQRLLPPALILIIIIIIVMVTIKQTHVNLYEHKSCSFFRHFHESPQHSHPQLPH